MPLEWTPIPIEPNYEYKSEDGRVTAHVWDSTENDDQPCWEWFAQVQAIGPKARRRQMWGEATNSTDARAGAQTWIEKWIKNHSPAGETP